MHFNQIIHYEDASQTFDHLNSCDDFNAASKRSERSPEKNHKCCLNAARLLHSPVSIIYLFILNLVFFFQIDPSSVNFFFVLYSLWSRTLQVFLIWSLIHKLLFNLVSGFIPPIVIKIQSGRKERKGNEWDK